MSLSHPQRADALDIAAPKRYQPLKMQEIVCGRERTLRLTGELDLTASPILEEALRRTCVAPMTSVVVVDLSALSFIDSTGIRALWGAKALCTEHGCELRLVPGPPQVQRVFEITDLLSRFPFAPPEAATPNRRRTLARRPQAGTDGLAAR